MNFPPTEEQQAILDETKSSTTNILIQALAGAAKTSTLVLIAKALPGRPILSVAFNKRIADEMAERLPSHCSSMTLNSIGHRAWAAATGKRLTVDRGKMGNILKSLELSRTEQEIVRENFSDIIQLSARAKLYGYVPEGRYEEALQLIDRETLEEVLSDFEYDPIAWALLDDMLVKSITQAYAGTIDYDDQLYMSTLFGAQLPRFPLTLVDEAQDLSPLNHQMLYQLVGSRRLIAVGDHFQSIYGFRGAVSDGMDVLRRRFDMKEFRLSISFRCPKSVILEARSHATYMRWAEDAPEGEVRRLRPSDHQYSEVAWGPNLFPDHSAIICRNNAPLFSLGLKLLRAGRSVTIRGMDISKRLIKIFKEFGDLTMPREELLEHLARWRQVKLAEAKLSEESIEDRYACLHVFASATTTLGEAIAHAERLFSAEGPIELLSGHKSKGLEWNEVFYLDPWRIPSKYATSREEKNQELNLDYVIKTRAKQRLTYIDLEDFDIELSQPYVIQKEASAHDRT